MAVTGVVAGTLAVFDCLEVDVAAGDQGNVVARVHFGGGQLQVVARHHIEVAADVDLTGQVGHAVAVGVAACAVLVCGKRIDRDVLARIQVGIAAGFDGRSHDGEVAPGIDVQSSSGSNARSLPQFGAVNAADDLPDPIHAGHLVGSDIDGAVTNDLPSVLCWVSQMASSSISDVTRGAFVADVASGSEIDVTPGQRAGEVEDVVGRLEVERAACRMMNRMAMRRARRLEINSVPVPFVFLVSLLYLLLVKSKSLLHKDQALYFLPAL